ncbi:DedA family protein [Virgibacillus salinus]|uniref:Membrane protein DedA, SNARE-associated domain n=1 Tax=Virgibacillus salinus TaxID=553311 RepID=A0A1H1FYN9_9BACI|nr:VTT domain-containing protein [Virgibacillus salinus]SDR06020.1 membrane protein DedA, SNARE-associated domain [Virgibacillus salinus]
MLQYITDMINELGLWGLFISLAVEASSVPFPGGLVTLTFGYILNLTFLEVLLYGFFGGAVYSLFSLIPYGVGYKLEDKLKQKMNKKKVEKAQRWFKKFGVWTIAFARPLGIGNYISYIAGISKVGVWKFQSLTLLGILPWTIGMLWLGSVGNLKSVKKFMEDFQLYILLLLIITGAVYWLYRRHKKRASYYQSEPT